ncbi:MAG: hypothetical protein AVDCRST_MAG07-448 [uncultured Frankineae bacterium]|uniref:Regulator of ribonuclease activity B domain-containing protein n=1 Tax=uncultured Frankineae bacterium TaxID=437475 RepID=A0A6J4KM72_9ACTN|nr:MAG: hypothetical protein AVDCRST_MAG07-448 [uncultured Frankineae bacterium]
MGLLARLRRSRTPAPVVLDPDDPSLVVLVEAFEAARADSAVLAEAAARGVELEQPLLVRHHLVALPDAPAVARAAELLAFDGYAVSTPQTGPRGLSVLATRTQVLTALSASQERSRMAGLAQRLGGDVTGWDALGPGPAAPDGPS